GKQGWRLLANPNTLVARIFKAKYYPRKELLTVPLGNNPSFVWKSIRKAQGIVGGGIRWKI
ncbi:hypothetical protein LINGRAHAP2_LOCUS11329, partial [Linum grandiflorum]